MSVINYALCALLSLLAINFAKAQCPSNSCESANECPSANKNEAIAKPSGEAFANDEFKDWSDEKDNADEFEEFSDTTLSDSSEEANRTEQFLSRKLNWALGALAFSALAGVFVRFAGWRNVRLPMLLVSLVFLGFYTGGCPCPISSVQDLALAGLGVEVHWQDLVWFLGLIPLTYIFGKTWCGWVCHLGALQEFVFRTNKFEFLRRERAQKIMKAIRWALLAALAIQLIIMKENWFCKIDPFKAAFNLTSYYSVGWWLLGLLLASSLFIYRPFCKAACPIGILLGFVAKIPGASVLSSKTECIGCSSGSKACQMDAIVRRKGDSVIDNKECITCGDCISACQKGALSFARKNKKNPTVGRICQSDE